MEKLVKQLAIRYPDFVYRTGRRFSWSPLTQEIFYDPAKPAETQVWSVLHETGHALLDHTTYTSDLELVRLEVAAWEKAKEIAAELEIKIDEDHLQDCLDTYRDWLHERSICPHCSNKSLQDDDCRHYQCFNCGTRWRVSPSRFCRAYRSVKTIKPMVIFTDKK